MGTRLENKGKLRIEMVKFMELTTIGGVLTIATIVTPALSKKHIETFHS
jgi:hypothetical protein